MNKEAQLKNLKSLLEYHDNLYYILDDPELEEAEYDKLKEKYFKLLETDEDEYEYVPGEAINNLSKVTHSHPIRSLSKVNSEEELRAAIEPLMPVIIEPKFDGLTVVGYPGTVTGAGCFATRGNGLVGENITNTAIRMEGINRVNKTDYTVRMEAYIPISVFNELNQEKIAAGEEPFKNPRNAAAGMLRQKDASKVRGIHYFAYNIIGSIEPETKQIERLKVNGFNTTPYWSFDDLDQAVDFVINFDKSELDYEIDGIVIKSNRPDSLAYFGETGHHPKNAVAYKFPPEGKWTTLNDVAWQVGRTGRITPIALFDSLELEGSTVTKATLHNMGIIDALGLKINSQVFVIKANGIIPAILECEQTFTRDNFPVIEPTECPECHGEVTKINNQLFCQNPYCTAQTVSRITHIAGRDALDIEGLSEETAQKIFDTGLVTHPFQIFDLTLDDILKLPGFAKKSADNLYNAIQKARNPELAKFIYSAGIPGVGRSMSRDIASTFGSLESWTDDAGKEFVKTKKIEGIGDETIKSLNEYGYLLGDLNEYVTPKTAQKKAEPTSGKVMTFVITGTLEQPRSYYEKIITDAGHKCSNSVSSKTNYVLVGTDAGSKEKKAIELGFESQGKILRSEEELRSKLW